MNIKYFILIISTMLISTTTFAASLKSYTCNMIKYSGVCREYKLDAADKQNPKTLEANCKSMGGSVFSQNSCPKEKLIARCLEVAADENEESAEERDKDILVYTNSYYSGAANDWSLAKVKQVCKHLFGKFSEK